MQAGDGGTGDGGPWAPGMHSAGLQGVGAAPAGTQAAPGAQYNLPLAQPAPPLDQLWMGMQQQLEVQPAGLWQAPLLAAAAAAAPPPPPPQSRLDPAAMAAKLVAAREKNRLAQQRFRERQRAKQKQAGVECERLQREMDQLEVEIEALQAQNRMYLRVLAVRDAMLQTFTSLQPPEAQAQALRQPAAERSGMLQHVAPPPQLPAPETAGGLARALSELPSDAEMDAAAEMDAVAGAASQQQAGAAGGPQAAASRAAGSAGSGSGEGSEAQPSEAGLPPQSLLGEPHRTGTAGSLDGSALQDVELIPPPSNQAVLARIASWSGPEDLLDFLRQWQEELRVMYQAADAAGFDADSRAEVEAVVDRMSEMWWHVGQLRPAYLSYLAHVAMPQNSSQLPLWREIAAEVMPYIDDNGLVLVRRSWHNYSKRLAKVAVGISKWVHKLREYTVQPPGGLVANAQRSLELVEISSHIVAAVQEEYVASMELVAAQFPVSSTLLKAYTNYRSSPYLPDIVAIVYNIVCLDSKQRALNSLEGYRPRLLATDPAPSSLVPAERAKASDDQQ